MFRHDLLGTRGSRPRPPNLRAWATSLRRLNGAYVKSLSVCGTAATTTRRLHRRSTSVRTRTSPGLQRNKHTPRSNRSWRWPSPATGTKTIPRRTVQPTPRCRPQPTYDVTREADPEGNQRPPSAIPQQRSAASAPPKDGRSPAERRAKCSPEWTHKTCRTRRRDGARNQRRTWTRVRAPTTPADDGPLSVRSARCPRPPE